MSGKATRSADDVPRELERAGELCLAFANTAAPRLDDRSQKTKPPPALGSYGDLVDWGRRMGVLEDLDAERLTQAAAERPEDAAVAFTRALSLRAGLVRIFTAVALGKPAASRDLETLNGALRAALPWRRLAGRGKSFHWQWDGDEEALDRMLWPVVASASELLLSDDLRWLRQCAGERCPRLFVDRGSRRRKWCDMNTCGSRPKGRRHYKRNLARRQRYVF
ncbi:MAG TPA: ABATE domain-containing protein [Thermoanaerobaculia bacterium]|jgi:predicted RNA-binding Zn ribbon-like protein